MPTLKNPRHEVFAQGLADGKSASEAYEIAGYKDGQKNAHRLGTNEGVLGRVRDILAERERIHGQSTAKAIQRVSLTKEWILAKLIDNAERALQARAVTDADGKETGEYRYQGAVANRALELLGKHLGMFVELHELSGKDGKPIQTQEVSPRDKLFDLLDGLATRGRAGEDKGKPH